MTKLDQINILNNKIRSNEAQFILDRKNAEISAKSSGELDKYEYLTGEDLGYKPDALTQAKFEYSPLGKVFTAGLDASDKKDGLFKRLRSIEDKSGILAGFYPQLPYYRPDKRSIDYLVDKKDDDDDSDDDDNKRKIYKQLESQKEDLIKRGYLDKSAGEKFDKFYRATEGMKNKKYILSKNNYFYKEDFKNNYYLNLFNQYLNDKNKYNNIAK